VIALPAFVSARMLLIGGAILVILIGLWAWGEKREDDGRSEVQAAWDDERATLISAAADAQAKARAMEQEFARAAQEATHAQVRERQRNARAVADIAGDRDRLRNQLETYAAGGGLSAGDPGPAASERAAKLGRALDDALSAHAACTAGAVDLAADVRALRAAWPVEVSQ
jgi:hypothetical protein